MDPPPFDHPMIRKCIKTHVRIQNHEDLQEVLILTTVLCSVESQLNRSNSARYYNSQPQDNSGGDGMSSSDEDMSGYSDTSDDSSDERNEESHSADTNRGAPQSREDERYKMKAFWLRKDPICEVCYLQSATSFVKVDAFN
jgi:hypothetical protein